MSITADPATNSLIVNASKTDWEKLKQLIDQLDVKRRQVLLEAILLEVGVRDTEELGAEFLTSTGGKDGGVLAKGDFRNLQSLFSDPTSLSAFSVAAASSGTLTLPGGITIPTQAALISAAQANTNANVLSAPNILATDNEPAEIVVGQNVPFVSSEATSDTNLNNTFRQIDRQDVGITLRFTPQISSADFVTLKVFTEVSSIVPTATSNSLGPTTTVRTSETMVIAKDGQMVVIGGLISDGLNETSSGIPFLKDIPVLGQLFRYDNSERDRRNLLIFITPRIIKDQFDLRDRTIASRNSMDKSMQEMDLWPNRQDILHSKNIDRVAESRLDDGAAPSAIRPPGRSAPTGTALSQIPTAETPAIELRVKPRLPGMEPETPKAKLAPLDPTEAAPTLSFVVLELVNRGEIPPGRLPFTPEGKHSRFAVEIPEDSTDQGAAFFRVGMLVAYEVGGATATARVIEQLSGKAELAERYPELKDSWYVLSPYEIMSLGSGPWRPLLQ